MDVDDTSVFVTESSQSHGSEERVTRVKKLVIEFKNKFSYEKPSGGGHVSGK